MFRLGVGGRRGADDEVDEELAFHLEEAADELEAEGLSPGEAREEVLRRFGDVEQTRRALVRLTSRRQEREGRTMRFAGWWTDLRYAGRTLRKNPGFAAVVILTLGLGIGANTAVFSVMNPYFFRPLPYENGERLVQVGHRSATSDFAWHRFSLPQIEDFAERNRTAEAVGWYRYTSFNVTGPEGPERIMGGLLSENAFEVLGARPVRGRTFAAGEGGPAGADVVVLDHGLWQRRYGADPAILGRTVALDGRPYEVIGVMAPDFVFPFGGVKLWVPDRRSTAETSRGSQGTLMIARRPEGTSTAQLEADFARVQAELAAEHPEIDGDWAGIHVAGLREALNFGWDVLRAGFYAFLAAVGAVLLIACVNVTSLMLARGQARVRELAVRNALGAGRGRIVRQLTTEAVVLASVGGALGILLAWLATRGLGGVLPEDFYRVGDPVPDLRVLLFTAGVTLATPVVFGLWPAWITTRGDLTVGLREGSGGSSQARRTLRLRRALVVAEVAVGVVLVAATGLLLRSALQLRDTDLGLDPSRMLTAEAIPEEGGYPERADHVAFWDEAVRRARALPGVREAGTVYPLPLNHETLQIEYASPETRPTEDGGWPLAMRFWSSPGYLDAAGIRLLAGRDFRPGEGAEEGEGMPQPIIVSARVARAVWPEDDAVGRTLRLRSGAEPFEGRVIGVIDDHYHDGIDQTKDPLILLPMERRALRRRFLVVGAEGEPAGLVPALRDVLRSLDPGLPVDYRPMSEIVLESSFPWTVGSAVLAVFGLVALLLAALGIYGVVAYSVGQRRRDMAIRMSLGAHAGSVRRTVVLGALGLSGVGVAVGLVGAVLVGRVAEAFLFGVSPNDPVALGGSVLVFLAVAALAAFLPARRAAKVAPALALRSE